MPRPAVFLDRDGVIIQHVDYLTDVGQVQILPGVPRAITRLRGAGFIISVATNQPVVALGYTDTRTVEAVHALIQERLEAAGASIDRYEYCPHHPRGTVAPFNVDCDCRKPQPGLILRAAGALDVDLRNSFMVGDRLADIVAGRRAGCSTILVESDAPPVPTPVATADEMAPDHTARDLVVAVDLILGSGPTRR